MERSHCIACHAAFEGGPIPVWLRALVARTADRVAAAHGTSGEELLRAGRGRRDQEVMKARRELAVSLRKRCPNAETVARLLGWTPRTVYNLLAEVAERPTESAA